VLWAVFEAKRDVLEAGVVGVPFFMSSAPSKMLEMSCVAVVLLAVVADCEALLLIPVEALSSWRLRIEVAKDRSTKACMGCVWQWEKATLLAGCLYTVGARKGMRECEERMMDSPAFTRSVATCDSVRIGRVSVVYSREVGQWLCCSRSALHFVPSCSSGVSLGGDFAANEP
jgi:hypothetical protein